MRLDWRSLEGLLVDPVDWSPLRADGSDALVSATGRSYRIAHGQPILLTHEPLEAGGWMFPPIVVGDDHRPKPATHLALGRRFQRLLRRAVGEQGAGERFATELRTTCTSTRPCVAIVGGASVGSGCEQLVEANDVDVISFDIYPTAETTFVADGHRIPLGDATVDGVWVQAVLEHVYRPELVVSEIVRVLKSGGLVYAETPFLQPVHEGAYDYLRFSVSGHRLLWAAFDEIDSGPLGGPGAVTNLAIRGLVGGVTRSHLLARVAYALTLPLGLIDRWVGPRWRADYTTGGYFLGRLGTAGARYFDAVAEYDRQD